MTEVSFITTLLEEKGGLIVLVIILIVGGRYVLNRLTLVVDNLFNKFTHLLEAQHEKCEEDLADVKKEYWSLRESHNGLVDEFKKYRLANLEKIVDVIKEVKDKLDELKEKKNKA